MLNDLIKLYNTLKLVETKGDSTENMADCMRYLRQMIAAESVTTDEANVEDESR